MTAMLSFLRKTGEVDLRNPVMSVSNFLIRFLSDL